MASLSDGLNRSRYQHRSRLAFFGKSVLCVALALAPTAIWGQGPKLATKGATPAVKEGRQLLKEAYQKSATASTVDDASAVLELCERAESLSLDAANVTYAKQLKAWAFNRRGEVYAEQAAQLVEAGKDRQANDLDAVALEDFSTALELDESKWAAYVNRGRCLALFGRNEEALKDFDKATQAKAAVPKLALYRAEVLHALGRNEEALADYMQGIQQFPNDADVLAGRSKVYIALGKQAAAIADLNLAIRVRPNDAMLHTLRGETHTALGNWNDATLDFRQAVRSGPKSSRAYRGSAWLLATCPEERFRNADTAIGHANRAIEFADSKDAQLLDVLAAAQANAGKYDEARATMNEAITMAPADQVDALTMRLANYLDAKPFRTSGPTENARIDVKSR